MQSRTLLMKGFFLCFIILLKQHFRLFKYNEDGTGCEGDKEVLFFIKVNNLNKYEKM